MACFTSYFEGIHKMEGASGVPLAVAHVRRFMPPPVPSNGELGEAELVPEDLAPEGCRSGAGAGAGCGGRGATGGAVAGGGCGGAGSRACGTYQDCASSPRWPQQCQRQGLNGFC
jgi:hypothetical protein